VEIRVSSSGVPASAVSTTIKWGSIRKVDYVQGTTLDRFVKNPDGTVTRKTASAAMKQLKCTHCAGPHRPDNLDCWASVQVGRPPPVIDAPPTTLWKPGGAKLVNPATVFKPTKTFPRSAIAIGTFEPV
jgi:hypothetical protein